MSRNVAERLQRKEYVTANLLRYERAGRVVFAGGHQYIVVCRSDGELSHVQTPGPWLGIEARMPHAGDSATVAPAVLVQLFRRALVSLAAASTLVTSAAPVRRRFARAGGRCAPQRLRRSDLGRARVLRAAAPSVTAERGEAQEAGCDRDAHRLGRGRGPAVPAERVAGLPRVVEVEPAYGPRMPL